MPEIHVLKNEWAESVAAVRAIADAPVFDRAAHDSAWSAQVEAKDKYDRASALDAAEQALNPNVLKVDDLRNSNDARVRGPGEKYVPEVDAVTANELPNGYIDLGSGRIVPYATDKSEGFIRGNPASVQLAGIMARYGPDLRQQADSEREAFLAYVRGGAKSRAFNDKAKRDSLVRLDAQNALQEGTDSEGGYLVPEDEAVGQIIHDPGTPSGVFRPMSRTMTTSVVKGYIPSGTTVTWAIIAEEAAGAQQDPAFGETRFNIWKSGFNNKVSMELLADSAFNIPQFLSMVGLEARGRFEDQQAIEGDGTTEPLGLRHSATTARRSTAASIPDSTQTITLAGTTVAEMLSIYFGLPAQFRNSEMAWAVTSSFMARLASLSTTGGNLGLLPRMDGAPGFNLFGHPMVPYDGTGWDDAASFATNEEFGALGDFSKYYFVDRLGVMFERDDSVGFETDQISFKMRQRFDSYWGLPNAFRIIKAA